MPKQRAKSTRKAKTTVAKTTVAKTKQAPVAKTTKKKARSKKKTIEIPKPIIIIKLISREPGAAPIMIEKEAAELSSLVKDCLEYAPEDLEISLPVNPDILAKIVDFMVHFKQNPVDEIQKPI